MKITKSILKQIIKEELEIVLNEQVFDDDPWFGPNTTQSRREGTRGREALRRAQALAPIMDPTLGTEAAAAAIEGPGGAALEVSHYINKVRKALDYALQRARGGRAYVVNRPIANAQIAFEQLVNVLDKQ